MTGLTGKFVILHHTGHRPEHWDFMLEEADALATWKCSSNPAASSPGQILSCRRLPDHRRAYLTYEGVISHGRGRVQRIEEGEYECIPAEEHHRRVRLHGKKFSGLVELRQDESDDGWTLQRLAEANPPQNA